MKFIFKISQVSNKKFNLVYWESNMQELIDEINVDMTNYIVIESYKTLKEAHIQMYKFAKYISPKHFKIHKINLNWLEFEPIPNAFQNMYAKI